LSVILSQIKKKREFGDPVLVVRLERKLSLIAISHVVCAICLAFASASKIESFQSFERNEESTKYLKIQKIFNHFS
jgi:hypothetical protein